jgi:hypothetical protein
MGQSTRSQLKTSHTHVVQSVISAIEFRYPKSIIILNRRPDVHPIDALEQQKGLDFRCVGPVRETVSNQSAGQILEFFQIECPIEFSGRRLWDVAQAKVKSRRNRPATREDNPTRLTEVLGCRWESCC